MKIFNPEEEDKSATKPQSLEEARLREIEPWVGSEVILHAEDDAEIDQLGHLSALHWDGSPDEPLPAAIITFEDGDYRVPPQLVTLPTDDCPRWLDSFVPNLDAEGAFTHETFCFSVDPEFSQR